MVNYKEQWENACVQISELEGRLSEIQKHAEHFEFLLRERLVKFHDGNHYRNGSTKEQRWGEIWVCNFIYELQDEWVKALAVLLKEEVGEEEGAAEK